MMLSYSWFSITITITWSKLGIWARATRALTSDTPRTAKSTRSFMQQSLSKGGMRRLGGTKRLRRAPADFKRGRITAPLCLIIAISSSRANSSTLCARPFGRGDARALVDALGRVLGDLARGERRCPLEEPSAAARARTLPAGDRGRVRARARVRLWGIGHPRSRVLPVWQPFLQQPAALRPDRRFRRGAHPRCARPER